MSLISFAVLVFSVFLFKQKTAYEMRISDWSSDVCSSDLHCCLATSSRASFSAAVSVIVRSVRASGLQPATQAARSLGGNEASKTRPITVQWAGSVLPTINGAVLTWYLSARDMYIMHLRTRYSTPEPQTTTSYRPTRT